MKRKVVYNSCYGGFGLSIEALLLYYKYKYPEKTLYLYQSVILGSDIELITLEKAKSEYFPVDILDKDFGPKVSDADLEDYYEHVVKPEPWDIERHDPILVRVVEELGSEKASGMCSSLAIADIGESLYRIEEYDGYENVVTPETQHFEWL